MLRILLVSMGMLAVFSACKRSADSKLIGSWRGHSEGMAGEIRFAADHTFTSREWDATNKVPGSGDWDVSGEKLVLNFSEDSYQPKHRELMVTFLDADHIALHSPGGSESTLERLK
jgi:hypothetical protein